MYSEFSVTAASSAFTPPVNSGFSTVGAASSPTVANGPVYSGFSVTAASSAFTPPVNSGWSTVGVASSPTVAIGPVYSGTSWTAASSALTPPANSGTSSTAGSAALTPLVIFEPATVTARLWMLSIRPSIISVIFWPISSLSIENKRVLLSYWVTKLAVLPFANFRVGASFTNTSESNSMATIPCPISIACFTLASFATIISLLKKSQLNFL